jgi:hypothetical protein
MINHETRRDQLLSEPVLLDAITNLARTMGVPEGEIPRVVRVTQKLASDAVVGRTPGQVSELDLGSPGLRPLEPIPAPPLDELAFVAWLLAIGTRCAARVARVAWIEEWRVQEGVRAGEPLVAAAKPQEIASGKDDDRVEPRAIAGSADGDTIAGGLGKEAGPRSVFPLAGLWNVHNLERAAAAVLLILAVVLSRSQG